MMPDHITRDEFTIYQDRVLDTLQDGFKGLNDRLDLLNGRTRFAENRLENVATRLGQVEADKAAAHDWGPPLMAALLTAGTLLVTQWFLH